MAKFNRSMMVITAILIFLAIPYKVISADQTVVKKTPPELRLQWYQQHVEMKAESFFQNLPFQFLGPLNVSGRMSDVAVVSPKGKNYTIYIAGASGGIWKTVNEGITWEPIFEHAPSTAFGDIALAPSNQNIIWAGTGEANIFRSSQAGAGVFKSSDAGKTWTHVGLTDTNTIARIVIHPENPEVVYVAASGNEWTDNEARGIYQTTDGGKTWEKIKYIDDKTGAIDLVMDPGNPEVLYAAFWQRIRKKWNDPRNEADYRGSGIFKTTDAGKTWTAINEGLPPDRYRGRIGIDLCRSRPEVIYAFVDNYEVIGEWDDATDAYGRPKGGKIKGATVYRSDNGGEQWRQVSQTDDYMTGLAGTYGWVFGQMRVDPNDPDTVYVMGLALNQSTDGGKTFRPIGDMHGDHHGLWIDPENSHYMVNVNDGGIAISYDHGENWRTFYHNLPLVQFFNVSYDRSDPFWVYGSIQDHGSYRGRVDLSRGRHHIPARDWEEAPGGEGSSHAIDPTDPDIVYSAGFYGTIQRTDMKTGETRSIVPKPREGESPFRGQWVAPFIISPHDHQVIYHGMNYLFRSGDRGDNWEKISPDLTYNDPEKLGDIPYQTIFSISESPLKEGLIYAGTDDGRLHVTQNGGEPWKEITKGLAYRKWIAQVTASRFDEGTVYVAQNGKRDDDFAAYLYKSTNYGRKWTDISANIPCGPVNSVIEDPRHRNILYVGTDYGVYVTLDQGEEWQVLCGNFPTTYVHDLVVQPQKDILVAATHGRGMWALDIRFIQQLTPAVLTEDLYLFRIEKARIPRQQWWRDTGGIDVYIGYYLKTGQEARIVITRSDGDFQRSFKQSAQKGLNFFNWDMILKTEGWRRVYAQPGEYTVTVTAGDHTAERKLLIEK